MGIDVQRRNIWLDREKLRCWMYDETGESSLLKREGIMISINEKYWSLDSSFTYLAIGNLPNRGHEPKMVLNSLYLRGIKKQQQKQMIDRWNNKNLFISLAFSLFVTPFQMLPQSLRSSLRYNTAGRHKSALGSSQLTTLLTLNGHRHHHLSSECYLEGVIQFGAENYLIPQKWDLSTISFFNYFDWRKGTGSLWWGGPGAGQSIEPQEKAIMPCLTT